MMGRERVAWIAVLSFAAMAGALLMRRATEPSAPPATPGVCPPASSTAREPWAPAAPSARFGAEPLIWDVLTHPDQFVGKETELTGYAIRGFEFAYLAQTPHELHNFEEWQTIRPGQHPHMLLLGLQLPRSDTGDGWSHLSGRRVRVHGRLMPPVDPGEPEPALRWAYGMRFEVDAIEER